MIPEDAGSRLRKLSKLGERKVVRKVPFGIP